MINLKTIIALLAIAFLMPEHATAQGWMVYKSDGTTVSYLYSEVDSIVTFPATSSPTGVVAVDLGLSSGTKWADKNIGASSSEGYGNYYAWGETETKGSYLWSTYMVTSRRSCGTSSDPVYAAGLTNIAGSRFDVATATWGGPWRMPTSTQISELINSCSWTWTTQNGVAGYKVTGPNGNSIFIPAAGYRFGETLDYAGSDGYYWSATLLSSNADSDGLGFDSGYHSLNYGSRYYGLTVRPVSE